LLKLTSPPSRQREILFLTIGRKGRGPRKISLTMKRMSRKCSPSNRTRMEEEEVMKSRQLPRNRQEEMLALKQERAA
jgi:hypothetical protein